MTGMCAHVFTIIQCVKTELIFSDYNHFTSMLYIKEKPKGIQDFFLFLLFVSSQVPDKKIDPILGTVCAGTRRRRAELAHR